MSRAQTMKRLILCLVAFAAYCGCNGSSEPKGESAIDQATLIAQIKQSDSIEFVAKNVNLVEVSLGDSDINWTNESLVGYHYIGDTTFGSPGRLDEIVAQISFQLAEDGKTIYAIRSSRTVSEHGALTRNRVQYWGSFAERLSFVSRDDSTVIFGAYGDSCRKIKLSSIYSITDRMGGEEKSGVAFGANPSIEVRFKR